jgi:RimJ/RimL family protein N-acetyltransferase
MKIETERLLLDRLTPADLDEFVAMHAEPAVLEFMPPVDRRAASDRFARDERDWHERGHGLVAIRARGTGRFLGRTGLVYWPLFDETEVGWVLRDDATGHGYATEAARAVVDWAFENLSVPYLTSMIQPANKRSLAVARRLGFTPLREDMLGGVPVVVHWLPRP